jgi:hypothetical protein
VKKSATKEESDHMSAVAELGCIVCRNLGYPDSPAGIHHIRASAGGGQRSSHFEVLPLCALHHLTGGFGTAYHAGAETWQAKYGMETELLEQVRALLDRSE